VKKFTIQPGAAPRHFHAVVSGESGSGKTSFAATFPRVLLLSDNVERGYEVVQGMNPDLWWNPKQVPEVWTLETIKDSHQAITDLEQMALPGRTFPYDTVAFDPVSIHCDRYLTEMPADTDRRQLYGMLWTYLFVIIRRLHSLPASILWLSHVRDGELAIPGQGGAKLPALCESKWHCEVAAERNQPPRWQLRTRPTASARFVSSRYALPDPMWPSFKCIARELDWRIKPASPWVRGEGEELIDWGY
jgi:hypothetical protein